MLLLLLKLTLVAAIGRLLVAALPRVSAATRYLVVMATFAALLVIPLIPAAGLRWDWSLLPAPAAKTAVVEPREPAASGTSIAVTAPFMTPQSRRSPQWRMPSLTTIWAAVALLLLARLAFGIAAISSITRRATDVTADVRDDLDFARQRIGVAQLVNVLTSSSVAVPLMWGVHKPVLLLPEAALEWSRERLQVVFLHELAHLRRRDALTLLFTRVAVALYWFHPLAWSLDRAARRDCEQACDDLVLSTGTRPSEYADHLLEIARSLPRRDPFGAVTLAMSRRSQLEGRLLSILQPDARRNAVSPRTALATIVIALIVTIPVGAMRLTEKRAVVVNDIREDVHHAVEGSVKGGVGNGVEEGADSYQNGKQYFRSEEYQRAADSFNDAIRRDPYNGSAWYNLACTYARMGDTNRALDTLEQAILHGFTGDSGKLRGDDDLDSIHGARFDQIARLADDLDLMGTRNDRDDWREAIAHHEEMVRRHPELPRAWFNLGFVKCEGGDENGAIEAFQRCLRANYRPATVMYNLGCSYARMGQRETAVDWLMKAQAAGFEVGDYARNDRDLDSVRRDPRVRELIEAALVRHPEKHDKDKHEKHKSDD